MLLYLKGDQFMSDNNVYLVTLHLNARLQPMHRQNIEDALEEKLSVDSFATISGGGSLLLESGEVDSCDIELDLVDGKPNTVESVLEVILSIPLPKGSKVISQDFEQEIGELEGMVIYLNGTDLSDDTYENYGVDPLIDELETLFQGNARLWSWWTGPYETALYFYGQSFNSMLDQSKELIKIYPLCEKCRIEKIA